jgi:hypothetical protein
MVEYGSVCGCKFDIGPCSLHYLLESLPYDSLTAIVLVLIMSREVSLTTYVLQLIIARTGKELAARCTDAGELRSHAFLELLHLRP